VQHPPEEAVARFAAVLTELEGELDWELLASSYCAGPAEGFFAPERRAQIVDVGLALASEVEACLPEPGIGRSLYVGAAVAELAPMLMERVVLEREVVWINRPGPELDELARGMAALAARTGLQLPSPSSAELADLPRQPCDHLWLVSVLTDPDAFPALHDELYERAGSPLATGRGDLALDRVRAAELVDHLLDRAALPCAFTTTDEELELVVPRAAARGLELVVPERFQLTALARDPVRVCLLRARLQAQG
jgi:hypothetical protein